MTGTIKQVTTNFSLRIPLFDSPGWGREMERNFIVIDAAMFALSAVTGVRGIWTNGTDYTAGDIVVDDAEANLWRCEVTHTSASTGTFAEDRIANPTYWALTGLSNQAENIEFAPTPSISSDNVQDAIEEVDSRITVSTLDPTGGNDGDVWFKVI